MNAQGCRRATRTTDPTLALPCRLLLAGRSGNNIIVAPKTPPERYRAHNDYGSLSFAESVLNSRALCETYAFHIKLMVTRNSPFVSSILVLEERWHVDYVVCAR